MLKKIIQKQLFGKSFLQTKIHYKYFNQQPPKFDVQKDYYNILNVSKDASDSQIKNSYYKLAKQYHPDISKGNEAKFKDISEAYEVLSGEDLRKQYDSARFFQSKWFQAGSKAQQGNYSYQEYQHMYKNMSFEEQQVIRKQIRARFTKYLMYFSGFIAFLIIFGRRPHGTYVENNGQLVPVYGSSLDDVRMDPNYQAYQQNSRYANNGPYQQQGFAPQYPQAPYAGGHPYAGSPYPGNGAEGPGPYGQNAYGNQYVSKATSSQSLNGGYPSSYPSSQYQRPKTEGHQPIYPAQYGNNPYKRQTTQSNYDKQSAYQPPSSD